MAIALLLAIYCICVVLASLFGGVLPGMIKLTHRRMQLAMSFVGGLMLGVALLHLLPHALAACGSIDQVAGWTLGGLLSMFLLIRAFHVHAHEHGDTIDVGIEHQHSPDEPCEHHHEHRDHARGQHPFSWLGLALGLSLHTLIDGVALGTAVVAESRGETSFALFGLGTFLAVALHKPLDALSITSLMAAGGWPKRSVQSANVAFAVLCPIGALAAAWGLTSAYAGQQVVIGCALAFAGGVFLCIALADLLPEVSFHAHDRLSLTAALLAGVGLAWAIGFFEPAHTHLSPEHSPAGSHSHAH